MTLLIGEDIELLNNGKVKFRQGKFKPRNQHKYVGDIDNIIFRSSWELRAFRFCDNNPNVLGWSSEEHAIPYLKPGKFGPKRANYYPDLYVEIVDREQKMRKMLIEIKPLKQTKPSKSRKWDNKLRENYAYTVNKLKWAAATEWCAVRGFEFHLMTENSLFK